MKVILKSDVKGSGKKGDIIEVSDGFAQNFLLKRGLAEVATASGINEVTQRKAAESFHKAEELRAAKGDFTPSAFVQGVTGVDNVCERAAVLSGGQLTIPKQVGDGVTVAVAVLPGF